MDINQIGKGPARGRQLRSLAWAGLAAFVTAGLAGVGAVWAQDPAPDLAAVAKVHAIAMHGSPKYGPDFTHVDYADPEAPKGGDVRRAQVGSFDSLNPYILEGTSPTGMEDTFFQTLTQDTSDEPFTEYGLLAESIQMPADRSWVAFTLRPEARWHDGSPVTPADVIFSLGLMKSKAHPFYQDYYADVVTATITPDQTILFQFTPGTTNRELPLIVGQMPVFQKAYWETHDFEQPTVDVPVSSGPYKIEAVEPGSSFTLVRDPDYWGKDLPINVGRYNFDKIQYDFYRDSVVALEAFKAGEYDWRQENSSKNWATGYDFPALDAGQVTKEELPYGATNGMQGWVFNMRRDIFKDPRVREAITNAFDFEWTNKNIMYDAYARSESYFSNSELASSGLPEGAELALLEPFRGQVPAEVFTGTFTAPSTGGTEEGLRTNLAKAVALLDAAGWTVQDNKLVDATGQQMKFEVLLDDAGFERSTGPFIDNLKKLGIDATMRTVDPSQYESLAESFDYDMIVHAWGQSLSPGNEQRNYWTCESAETDGSANYAGICEPAIDAMVDQVIQAESREDLVTATRALDRLLLWGHYAVPQWYNQVYRVAYWNAIDRPETTPELYLDFDSWFSDTAQAAAIREAQAAIEFVEPTEEGAEAAADAGTPAASGEATAEVTVEATAAADGAEGDDAGGTGGLPGGTIALVILAIVVVGAVYLFMRSRGSDSQPK
jgi:microcin C transport system substrate-binding protein